MLEAVLSTNRQAQLILYAPPGTTNLIETEVQLPPQGVWTSWQSIAQTNLFQFLAPWPATNHARFFRAVRQ